MCNVHYLPLKQTVRPDDLLKDVFADVGVDGTERVIQEVDIPVLIDGSRQTHPLLLAAAQVDALRGIVNIVVSRLRGE